ncbi:MAG TPA: hypothetical protein VJT31_36825, partial [Rugosimonospora sp.]|nr:hypothetical protein [Rugosimonospora sp.]
ATAEAALGAAGRWVRETQRADGSWGRWTGTVEETAYAVQALVRAGTPATGALARGAAYLAGHDDPDRYPGLWHAKDLYAPVRVIQAARLAALHLAGTRPVPAQRSGSSTIARQPTAATSTR